MDPIFLHSVQNSIVGLASKPQIMLGSKSVTCIVFSEWVSSTQEWVISCTNLEDSFWRRELTFEAIDAIRIAAGVSFWPDFFAIVRHAMLANSIFISPSVGRTNLDLRFTTEGLDLPLSPTPVPFSSPSSSSSSSSSTSSPSSSSTAPASLVKSLPKIILEKTTLQKNQAFNHVVVSLVDSAQRAATLSHEVLMLQQSLASAQAEASRLKQQLNQKLGFSPLDHDDHDESDDPLRLRASPQSGMPTHAMQRKRRAPPKRSLIVPTQRRPFARGAKLGEMSDSDD